MILNKQKHQRQVQLFLQDHFSDQLWELSIPRGSGNETYFAKSNQHSYFVKLGGDPARYQTLASIGITPQILAAGYLEDGTSIIVQTSIIGKMPSRRDFQNLIDQFASVINKMHHHVDLIQILPKPSSQQYRAAGLDALEYLQQKWERYKSELPDVVCFIDESLEYLKEQIMDFWGSGLVASHNDVCNGNWLVSDDGHLYIIDLESMSVDDPAVDLGALLWWYYPKNMRSKFLLKTGHIDERGFEKRMQVRMAMHCLNILLPHENSFDKFNPGHFNEALIDFKTVLAGKENPQGYDD